MTTYVRSRAHAGPNGTNAVRPDPVNDHADDSEDGLPLHMSQKPGHWTASQVFSLDPRSLAALRISLGLFCVTDVFSRVFIGDVRLLTDTFSSRGNRLARGGDFGSATFSIYFAAGLRWQVYLLAAGHILAGLTYALGWRTRASGIVLWIMQVSIYVRTIMANNRGDDVLMQLLLWSLFLPCSGQMWSVDCWLASSGASESIANDVETVSICADDDNEDHRSCENYAAMPASWASAGVLLLIPQIFLQTGWQKLLGGGPEWHIFGWRPSFAPPRPELLKEATMDGTSPADAVALTLCVDRFVLGPGRLLRELSFAIPGMTQHLTAGTLIIECLMPLLLFLPLRPFARCCLVALFAAFMTGLGLCMWLGVFPWAMIIGLLPHVPAMAWDRVLFPLAGRLQRTANYARLTQRGRHAVWMLVSHIEDVPNTRLHNSGSNVNGRRSFCCNSWRTFWRTGVPCFLCLTAVGLNFATLPFFQPWPAWLIVFQQHVVHAFQIQQDWPMFKLGINHYGGWAEIEGETQATRHIDVLRSLKQGAIVHIDREQRPELHLPHQQAFHETQRWLNVWNGMLVFPVNLVDMARLACNEWEQTLARASGAPLWRVRLRFITMLTSGLDRRAGKCLFKLHPSNQDFLYYCGQADLVVPQWEWPTYSNHTENPMTPSSSLTSGPPL